MIFSYNWLQSFFNKELPGPKKLAQFLTMHSFEVESVEKRKSDWILDIDVLPNRAGDCLCHLGVAREIAAITKLRIKNEKLKIAIQNSKSNGRNCRGLIHQTRGLSIEVKNPDLCPRYSAKVITNVKVGPSSRGIRERLEVCGLQPINNIVDIANYVMLEIGQPIHTFDADKVGNKIIVRRAKKGEKLRALDDKTYQLDEDVLVIADSKRPIAVAGIKGGENTGVDVKTKNIIIEAANFNQRVVRNGSQKLKLRTDASWRFENGLDPNLVDFAQERVASLIQEIAGGQAVQGLADFYAKKVRPKKIKLDLDYMEKLLGVKIPQAKVISILKTLGFEPSKPSVTTHRCVVTVPTWRLDINIPEDLIEEIGRIYGYEKIPAVFPNLTLIPAKRNLPLFWQKVIRQNLKELGFSQIYNYSFIGQKDKENFGLGKELVELENPISSEFQYLRSTLLINLLKNVKENRKNFDRFSIFESGRVFGPARSKSVLMEKEMLSGLIFAKKPKKELFYELKGVCDALLGRLGISDVWYDEYQPSPEQSKISFWQKGRCAEIKLGNQEVGFLGEISLKILAKLKIEKVVAFELDLEKLINYASEEHEYQPISAYPAAVRDIAVLVPLSVKVVNLLNIINAAGGKLVRDVDLFDIYEGEELPEGKKNLAFHIVFQAEDRTLKPEEIDRLMGKIIRALEEQAEWEVRR